MILILSANHLHKDSFVHVKCTRTRRIFKNRDLFENEKISFFIFDWFSSRRTTDIAHRTTLYLSKQPSLIAGYNKTLGSPDRGDPISLSKFRFSFRRRRDGRKTKTEKLVAGRGRSKFSRSNLTKRRESVAGLLNATTPVDEFCSTSFTDGGSIVFWTWSVVPTAEIELDVD